MAEQRQNRQPSIIAGVEAMHFANERSRLAAWAAQIVEQRQTNRASSFATRLFERFATDAAPGIRAADLADRFILESMAYDAIELTISPYAPPLRQLSTVRQGAPMWSAPPTIPLRPEAAIRSAPTPANATGRPPARDDVPDDLRALLQLHRSKGRI